MPRLADLAERVGGEVRGDGGRSIAGIASLEEAAPDQLALWVDPRLRAAAEASRACALLVDAAGAGRLGAGRDLLVVADPRYAFACLLALFHPPARPPAGVHPTAVLAAGCRIDPSAHVGPYAVIGEGAEVGAEAVVEAHVVVGRGCRLGRGAWLHPHAVLYAGSEVGERCEVHAGAVIGSDGFGYVPHGGVHHKVPQVGRAVLEADVEVGANAAVDRATLGETRIGAGSKLDNLVQVGHNVRLGKGCVLSGQAGVAGSAKLGDGVVMGGQSGSSGHLEIGDGVQVAAKSAVLQSVPSGARVAGIPAVDLAVWRRQVVALAKLGELRRRVAALERRLGAAADEEEA
jgi:UDP-3-O-[3-hydroxymyristoyl] glucosamine N-acyltransferase